MNTTIVVGNLTKKPEIATFNGANGPVQVCNFGLAVNEGKDKTTFFNVSAYGSAGKNCAQYLDKGRKVLVEGTVSARAYVDKDGKPAASLQLSTYKVEFLGGGNSGNSEGGSATNRSGKATKVPNYSAPTPVAEEPADLPW